MLVFVLAEEFIASSECSCFFLAIITSVLVVQAAAGLVSWLAGPANGLGCDREGAKHIIQLCCRSERGPSLLFSCDVAAASEQEWGRHGPTSLSTSSPCLLLQTAEIVELSYIMRYCTDKGN